MPASIGPSVSLWQDHLSQDDLSVRVYPLRVGKKRKRRSSTWDRAFGRRMKVAREARQFTQQDMADRLRLKLDTYQKYEAGVRSFPKDLIVGLIQHTHYGPWFFLTGQPDDQAPPELPLTSLRAGDSNGPLADPRKPLVLSV